VIDVASRVVSGLLRVAGSTGVDGPAKSAMTTSKNGKMQLTSLSPLFYFILVFLSHTVAALK
jgi:hypothetical protein